MSIEILSQKAVTAVIIEIGSRAKALQADIHQAAVSTLDHCREFGDYRGALALVNALPNGQRVLGLVEWYTHFSNGKLKISKDQENGGFKAELSKDRVDGDFDIPLAMATDYGSFTKESTPKTLSVEAFIKMLESKANDDKINTDGTPKVSAEARIAASNMVNFYRTNMLANKTN